MSDALFSDLLHKLQAYKKKYYLNRLLKGLIFFFALAFSAYLILSIIEYYGRYNSVFRFVFLSGYLVLTIIGLSRWIIIPLAELFALRRQMSNEQAAKEIGRFFPQVSDKLLNTLQLNTLDQKDNLFIQASISQKTKELSIVPFTQAVNYKENNRYLRYLGVPLAIFLVLLIFIPEMLTESAARIINYNKEYSYPAPFTFEIQNKELNGYRHEDFVLQLKVDGSMIPSQVFIQSGTRKIKLIKSESGVYTHTFKNLQKDERFYFEAAGYTSPDYILRLFSRPNLKTFDIEAVYPAYLNKSPLVLSNAGHLTIPEGTRLKWNFITEDVENIIVRFSDPSVETAEMNSANNRFSFTRKINQSLDYHLDLENKYGRSKDKISYHINVIPDQYPEINAETYKDSVLYNYVTVGGSVSDDYGLSKLNMFYRIVNEKSESRETLFKNFPVKINNNSLSENFIINWPLDSFDLKPDQQLEYYIVVWDNDGVNGPKSSKSKTFSFLIPDKETIREEMKSSAKSAEQSIVQSLSKSKQLKKDIEDIENRLKTKNQLNWQDKKAMEELTRKHEELKKEIEELKKEYDRLSEKQEKFNKPDEDLKQKMEQLQKLMDELLDEETRKLYEEMQKLLQDKIDKNELQKLLEQIKQKDNTIHHELERTLEWFKQIQFEQKLNEIKNDLQDLSKEQKELSEETKDDKKSNKEELLEKQEKLNEEFKNIEKDLNDLEKLNNDMKNKNDMGDMGEDKEEIKSKQQKGTEQLRKNQNKNASESQKDAAEKMREMADKMAQMQNQTSMEQAEENMEDLRAILDNLLKLSFDQEDLMKDFRKVNQSDPRYIELSQKQFKLKDDSKIIEDSLMALAERVFQIQSFVTREVGEMNRHMDASIKNIRDRRPDLATGNQQFTMTSVNNLALMLNDVLKQMQQQLAQMQGGSQMCNKPGQNKKPGLGDLQKQLNQQIEQMKKGDKPGGNPGGNMSKEIAKMAAQQEMIRNALKELQKQSPGGDKSGKELSEILKEMEQSEKDLVNKNISQELLQRQKEILTRLLEAEKSLRERDADDERESNQGKEINRDMPPDFEKYLKEKEKQIELLKTVNPSLTPYYKKEVNEYFQKIGK